LDAAETSAAPHKETGKLFCMIDFNTEPMPSPWNTINNSIIGTALYNAIATLKHQNNNAKKV